MFFSPPFEGAAFSCERSRQQDKRPRVLHITAVYPLPGMNNKKAGTVLWGVCVGVCTHPSVRLNLPSSLSEKQWKQCFPHRLLPMIPGNLLLFVTVKREEKEQSVFKGVRNAIYYISQAVVRSGYVVIVTIGRSVRRQPIKMDSFSVARIESRCLRDGTLLNMDPE